MGRRLAVPPQAAKDCVSIDYFAGNDLTSSPEAVALSRSPHAPNMIRDVPGKVCKMVGYETLYRTRQKINGCYVLQDNTALLHIYRRLYHIVDWDMPLPEPLNGGTLNNCSSHGAYVGNRLYIFDGNSFIIWDGIKLRSIDTEAKTPTVTIAGKPEGGGAQYEQLNMLTPFFRETFVGTQQDKVYKLSYAPLDAAHVEAVVYTGAQRLTLQEGTDFTVNRAIGQVIFNSPPGMPPTAGEPNVEIVAAHTVISYRDRICTTTAACVYGINSAQDRLFVGGGSDFPYLDYFSEPNDGAYFGDMNYSIVGGRDPIIGYSLLDGYLLTYKDSHFNNENIIARSGTLIDNKPAFPVTATFQSPGLASADTIEYLAGEPLFLCKDGIMAVTRTEADGTRYVQGRSYYLNGALTKCELKNAKATVWQDFYVLAAGGKLWMLDGLQPTARAQGMPWSARQYEGYVRENCPAVQLWQQNGRLFFGTEDGRICRFKEKSLAPNTYVDDWFPVQACWDLPDFSGRQFYKNKTFTYLAVALKSAPITGVAISAKYNGERKKLCNQKMRTGYMSFAHIMFAKITFMCENAQHTIGARIRIKKVDKAGFRLENEDGEPFGLTQVAIEYTENGKYK